MSAFLSRVWQCKATLAIIAIWTALHIIRQFVDLMTPLSGIGFNAIQGEYYRIFTGWLMHVNIIHLLANISGMLFAGYFLEPQFGSVKFALFAIIAAALEELIYSGLIFRDSQISYGGSSCVFALLGLIIVSQLLRPELPRFRLGTWYGNWLLGYAVLGNLPLLSFFTWGTVATHAISLGVGGILGVLMILLI